MSTDLALRLAYGFNLLVLGPVLLGLYAHRGAGVIAAIGGQVYNADGLRLLVGALWSAVLLTSIFGLLMPRQFVAVLAFQVIYKAIYLGSYVVPVIATKGWHAAPWGPTVVFAVIVIVYPFVIAQAWR